MTDASATASALVRATKHRLRTALRSYLTTHIAANPALRDLKSRAIASHLTAHPLFTNASSVSIFLSMNHEVNTDHLVRAALDAGKHVFVPCMVPCSSDNDGPPIPPATSTSTSISTATKTTKKRTKLVMVPLRDAQDYASLPLDKWGIPTPADPDARQPWGSNAPDRDGNGSPVDLVIVPGVAFDVANGGRCGYGRGFYDDWFARHGGQRATRCAVAFDVQVLDFDRSSWGQASGDAQEEQVQAIKRELDGKVPVEEHDVKVQWVVTESGGVMQCGL
ncbi:hypothetical protein BCR44DRAFT_1517244 [Catenaria anguillulae PL171]|uniref:5-formyltetrahydrofolate cyclo-ligase n=1 Tax=Catenaria anguillulae PL171 TaxID=765915 RepID=A0A1Y2H6S1_9FUNG|nr:hypothetical protein BCR44DRAFT_1517244 [Catenaria anguillulae PL171]